MRDGALFHIRRKANISLSFFFSWKVIPATKRSEGSAGFIRALLGGPTTGTRKKHLREQVLFSVKFVPAERVKYADACEIAYGSEMRFAREENEFHFTFCEAKYFTISARKLFHIRQRRIFHFHRFPTEANPWTDSNRHTVVCCNN